MRIAITGLGMVTPLGHDTASTWSALLAGKSGIDIIQSFDASGFPTQIAAEVKGLDANSLIRDKKLLRYALPQTAFAMVVSEEALSDAGIRPTEATATRWGCVVGSGLMTEKFSALQRFQ